MIEFEKEGLRFGKQVGIQVVYEKKVVGDYVADFIVDGRVVVEIKALVGVGAVEKAQLINYLKATGKEVGLLLNFEKKTEVKSFLGREETGLKDFRKVY